MIIVEHLTQNKNKSISIYNAKWHYKAEHEMNKIIERLLQRIQSEQRKPNETQQTPKGKPHQVERREPTSGDGTMKVAPSSQKEPRYAEGKARGRSRRRRRCESRQASV